MNAEEKLFLDLHQKRCQQTLEAMQAWIFGERGLAQEVGPNLILVHASVGNPEKHLLPHMENVRTYGRFPAPGGGCARGFYRGVEVWLLHQFMGCTATQLWMGCLQGTGVHHLIGLGEMTAYPDDVSVGDIVLPISAIRGDLIGEFHAPPNIPAMGDPGLLRRVKEKLTSCGWPVHQGTVYSGMPGGVGVNNPILREKIWVHIQAGILGNAIETSVMYLESMLLGIRAADLWVVSDDIVHGVFEDTPSGRERWEHGWGLISHAALDTLADIAAEEGGK